MDFMSILNKNVGDIKRPPNMPIGTYRAMVLKYELSTRESEKGAWDIVDFIMQVIAPTEDVDTDDLQEYGDVSKKQLRNSFMFDKNDPARFAQAEFGLKRFLADHLQIDGADTMPLKEALANSVNQQCLVAVKWRQDPKDPEAKYDEISRTAPVE